MCFGGGPSAEQIYNEKYKKEPAPLPSLSMQKAEPRKRRLKDTGAARRSLLNPYLNQGQSNATTI